MRSLLAALLLGLTLAAHAQARPEVGRYVKAWSGPEGIVVWTLRYGPPEAQEALVQVNGIDHKWDHRILRVKTVPMQNGSKFILHADGRQYEVLTADDAGMELLVPGMARRLPLRYEKDLSSQGNAQHFLTEYEEQK